jgi:hypothetical protein
MVARVWSCSQKTNQVNIFPSVYTNPVERCAVTLALGSVVMKTVSKRKIIIVMLFVTSVYSETSTLK